FQINSYTPGGQYSPVVASDSSGNFVVIWHSNGSSGGDTDAASIQGQRYAASGATAGGQFQVNPYTTGNQFCSAVASDSSGNFVVVWESYGSVGNDNAGSSIQGQRYNPSGAAVGTNFQVNTYTTGNQFEPSVASDANGNFVVV